MSSLSGNTMNTMITRAGETFGVVNTNTNTNTGGIPGLRIGVGGSDTNSSTNTNTNTNNNSINDNSNSNGNTNGNTNGSEGVRDMAMLTLTEMGGHVESTFLKQVGFQGAARMR